MANVHGFRDYRENRNRNREGAGGFMDGRRIANVPFLTRETTAENVRGMGFFDTFHSIFCPFLKAYSVVAIASILHIVLYILMLIHSVSNYGLNQSTTVFLGPHPETLEAFGAKVLPPAYVVSLQDDVEV
eukprot:TRINITY_DN40_c0_g1_i17.p2 TRINITY_DN40_c0_g1~~TRINITY_DN40_c0_g1_i17.p2  ORF type:complete len:130 (-),score=20.36 TRINITY_DN40_c0_g1_i17:245-634(-)